MSAAQEGTPVGIVLALDRDPGVAPTFSIDHPCFAVPPDGTVVVARAGALGFETETETE